MVNMNFLKKIFSGFLNHQKTASSAVNGESQSSDSNLGLTPNCRVTDNSCLSTQDSSPDQAHAESIVAQRSVWTKVIYFQPEMEIAATSQQKTPSSGRDSLTKRHSDLVVSDLSDDNLLYSNKPVNRQILNYKLISP